MKMRVQPQSVTWFSLNPPTRLRLAEGLPQNRWNIAGVDLLEQKLRAANVRFEFQRYQAKHAFANETLVGELKLPIAEYHAPSAELAWRRTLEFFDRHLK